MENPVHDQDGRADIRHFSQDQLLSSSVGDDRLKFTLYEDIKILESLGLVIKDPRGDVETDWRAIVQLRDLLSATQSLGLEVWIVMGSNGFYSFDITKTELF